MHIGKAVNPLKTIDFFGLLNLEDSKHAIYINWTK